MVSPLSRRRPHGRRPASDCRWKSLHRHVARHPPRHRRRNRQRPLDLPRRRANSSRRRRRRWKSLLRRGRRPNLCHQRHHRSAPMASRHASCHLELAARLPRPAHHRRTRRLPLRHRCQIRRRQMERPNRRPNPVQPRNRSKTQSRLPRRRRHARLRLRHRIRQSSLEERQAPRRQLPRLSPGHRPRQLAHDHHNALRRRRRHPAGHARHGERNLRRFRQLASQKRRERHPSQEELRAARIARDLPTPTRLSRKAPPSRARSSHLLCSRPANRQREIPGPHHLRREHERPRHAAHCHAKRQDNRQILRPPSQPLRALLSLPQRRLSRHPDRPHHAHHGPIPHLRLARQPAARPR